MSKESPSPITLEQVEKFWQENPLFVGESKWPAGSKEFFEEQRLTCIYDAFAGHLDTRLFPQGRNLEQVLDLGCGPGFFTIELAKRGAKNLMAVDLTPAAIELAEKRCQVYQVPARFQIQNAEKLTFPDATFTHVHCNGVIHYAPDPEACVREMARVLKPGGTAMISVYYRNIYLRSWPLLKPFGKLLGKLGAGMHGRGREKIYTLDSTDEIVRYFDGSGNPLGKAFSRSEYRRLLEPYFEIEEIFFHFFPRRSFPFKIPGFLHRFLDRHTGFLIFARLRKKES
jgi:SAM-dependent methyltransferase